MSFCHHFRPVDRYLYGGTYEKVPEIYLEISARGGGFAGILLEEIWEITGTILDFMRDFVYNKRV